MKFVGKWIELENIILSEVTQTQKDKHAAQSVRCYSHGSHETDEEFDARWVTYFNKPDIDAWELRKGMNTLVGYDLVPEPKIIDAALRACRRLNDFASAVRILEVVKMGFPRTHCCCYSRLEMFYLNKFSFEYQTMY
ncbi:hypothetical protein STEG23_033340 [Scotinomys teguina]